ncbi:MAG: pyridoxamine 5'-phosphate oxidase family protein [Ancalomicrobiaceae bacterium]|nr:pyridoxamine 5'-phosphate oxidase family protein [Ancalomicrobiaceae bacterium]
MHLNSEAERDALDALWRRVADLGVVMFGTGMATSPLRPMRPFASRDECAIWFFLHRSSQLNSEIGEGCAAHLVLIDGATYASVIGRAEPTLSQMHVDLYWSAPVAAMFPAGKDDPDLVLLRFTPQRGWLWNASAHAVPFSLEMALAGLIGDPQDAPTASKEVSF